MEKQIRKSPHQGGRRERERVSPTWVSMYPVEARSGRRIEQATRTDVIPAAVPSMVFSGKFAQVSGLKEKAQTGRKDNTYCQFCST